MQKAKDKAIQAALAAAEADYEADRQKAARRAQPANVKKVSFLSMACCEVIDCKAAIGAAAQAQDAQQCCAAACGYQCQCGMHSPGKRSHSCCTHTWLLEGGLEWAVHHVPHDHLQIS